MSELWPCPFCGSDEVFVSQTVQGSSWVVCENMHCGANGPMQPSPAEAVAAWNSRAPMTSGAESGSWPAATAPVLPVEVESRRAGDIAAFRASEVELVEAFDFTRPCLGRAIDRMAGDLILVQVSGTLQGGFAWAYVRPRAAPAHAGATPANDRHTRPMRRIR